MNPLFLSKQAFITAGVGTKSFITGGTYLSLIRVSNHANAQDWDNVYLHFAFLGPKQHLDCLFSIRSVILHEIQKDYLETIYFDFPALNSFLLSFMSLCMDLVNGNGPKCSLKKPYSGQM